MLRFEERRESRGDPLLVGKSLESLEPARRDLSAESLSFAINRAYYDLFYAVSALLLEEGHRFQKHSGVRSAFNQPYIKTRRLDRKGGDLYNRLFRERQEGDYIEFTKFDAQYVADQISCVRSFVPKFGRSSKLWQKKNSDPRAITLDRQLEAQKRRRPLRCKKKSEVVAFATLPNERRVAEDRRDCYWLCVVTSCKSQACLQGPIKNPARFPWHEVRKVDHYYLPMDALIQPMQVRDVPEAMEEDGD